MCWFFVSAVYNCGYKLQLIDISYQEIFAFQTTILLWAYSAFKYLWYRIRCYLKTLWIFKNRCTINSTWRKTKGITALPVALNLKKMFECDFLALTTLTFNFPIKLFFKQFKVPCNLCFLIYLRNCFHPCFSISSGKRTVVARAYKLLSFKTNLIYCSSSGVFINYL